MITESSAISRVGPAASKTTIFDHSVPAVGLFATFPYQLMSAPERRIGVRMEVDPISGYSLVERTWVDAPMLVFAIYAVCLTVIAGYTIFVLRNWSKFKVMDAQDQSSFLSDGVQIIFIALGSMVAAYSLDLSIFDTERQKNIRTTELFEEFQPEKISRLTWRYREFASLVFDTDFRPDLNDDERLEAISALWSGGIENDFSWVNRAMSRLLQCGELAECNEKRVNVTVCSNTDDLIRNLAREPTISIPGELTNFVYWSRDSMADYQRRSCGFVQSAIDYIDEAARE
ncbi:MAG TPA: hypothetical protein VLA52_08200 [Thermohalobaculum sp.]|nr:hypothetical protein [Thermohalobaculum sp.]